MCLLSSWMYVSWWAEKAYQNLNVFCPSPGGSGRSLEHRKKLSWIPGTVAHVLNPTTWKALRQISWVWDRPALHGKFQANQNWAAGHTHDQVLKLKVMWMVCVFLKEFLFAACLGCEIAQPRDSDIRTVIVQCCQPNHSACLSILTSPKK